MSTHTGKDGNAGPFVSCKKCGLVLLARPI